MMKTQNTETSAARTVRLTLPRLSNEGWLLEAWM